jgi:uncharacterized membrane protein YkvA (DUF1232 family)
MAERENAGVTPGAEPEWRVKEAILAIARRLPSYLRLAWGLARDSRVPPAARRWVVAAGLYNLSPLDPIPGIIPVLGQLDDYAVLLLAIRRALRACPPDLREEHLARSGVVAAQIDQDLQEMRRIAGHLTRSAARGAWAGLRFAAGMGVEMGRQLAVGVARAVDPKPAAPGKNPKEEAAPQ